MTLDVKNFNLNMPMVRYKYVRIKIKDIPEEIIVEYKLHDKVSSDGHVYVEIQNGDVWFAASWNISTGIIGKAIEWTWLLTE
jgi:hypothetical protein